MAENTINDFNTLPEQVQINKEDIETNTADITKLKDDISKIKPNAWEERKFKIDAGEGAFIDCTTYNPITNINNPLNNQKTFADKDTYSMTDPVNSYSYAFSANMNDTNTFTYIIWGDPSITIQDLLDSDDFSKDAIFYQRIDDGEIKDQALNIYCTILKAKKVTIEDGYIDGISNTEDVSDPGIILSSSVISYNYLKKTDASNTYATNTKLNDAKRRIDALDTGRLDIGLTTPGLAKLQTNPTIGTSISLTKDIDFSEHINGENTHKTILFSIYTDKSLDFYISRNIKLDVGYTANLYGSNDQDYTWLTGIGVIKLGNKAEMNNQYLCYISYSKGYITPLFITPIKKLV